MAGCTLKSIPQDLYKEIALEQKAIKDKKEINVYSIEQTIIHMLKEYVKCRKEKEQEVGNG